jgi:hypothetical protein
MLSGKGWYATVLLFEFNYFDTLCALSRFFACSESQLIAVVRGDIDGHGIAGPSHCVPPVSTLTHITFDVVRGFEVLYLSLCL